MLVKIIIAMFICAFQFSANAFEVLSTETIVSPGCVGGVLSHRTISSFIKDADELNESNSFDESLDELEEEPSELD